MLKDKMYPNIVLLQYLNDGKTGLWNNEPQSLGGMPVKNMRSCRLLPVAKYRKVATSLCSRVMACRMQVSCFII